MERIGELAYNPVRDHIRMNFLVVPDKPQQLDRIVADLREKQFDPVKSRVLIFARSRRRTEEAAAELEAKFQEAGKRWKVDFFHAGLDSDDREQKYHAFKTPTGSAGADSIEMLVATKAFGMGMDIPNVHYIYHLGPSSTFEDFLQEVGRAGRHPDQLAQAGFSSQQPIQAKCLVTPDEFRHLRDQLHGSMLSWNAVADTQKAVHQYVARFRPLAPFAPDDPLPLPLDLPQTETDAAESDGAIATQFRLALYWLERAGRLRLGYYTPATLPVCLLDKARYDRIEKDDAREQVKQLVAYVREQARGEQSTVALSLEDARTKLKISLSKLMMRLVQAQWCQALRVERTIRLEVTDLRQTEIQHWLEQGAPDDGLPTVGALFAFARTLMARAGVRQQRHVDGEAFDEARRQAGEEAFTPGTLNWTEVRGSKQLIGPTLIEDRRRDWQKKRAKFALPLLRLLPKVRVKSEADYGAGGTGAISQLIYNGNADASAWKQSLADLEKHLRALIEHVARRNGASFNYVDLLLHLKVSALGFEHLDSLLFLARALGYIKGNGSFIPMGIELYLQDVVPLAADDPAAPDHGVRQEFIEAMQLKELRLLTLECLAKLPLDEQDEFIKRYFGADGSAAVVGLLTDYLGAEHPQLLAFHEQALEEAEAQLNDEQRHVYDAPLDQHLQVIAGPGSGKTHTLTLRVARLIQREKVPPGQILVLAYNRAVVVELKQRLGKLFQRLGYGRLIRRLLVDTFHSFCLRVLPELKGTEFDQWAPALNAAIERDPNLISRKVGSIRYVFVDEFQDINQSRLSLLLRLAPPDKTRLCVIGDPNQSIYGYERANEGGPVSPQPYYARFQQLYEPTGLQVLNLATNYRSYPAILTAAAALLASNQTHAELQMPTLRPARLVPHDAGTYCEILDANGDNRWEDKLLALLNEPPYNPQEAPDRRYQQVALMFRSNDEVFRAFNKLQNLALPADVAIRIQGASSSPVTSREFFHLLQPFREQPAQPLTSANEAALAQRKAAAIKQYPNWDPYLLHLCHCLLRELLAENPDTATHQDLLDFVADLARRDDGHFAKLYEKHIAEIAPGQTRREVVLTTMHKVKGLEFDAVLIPPSFADFKADSLDNVEEARRLLYVAYTRARYRLVVIRWECERAIAEGRPFILENREARIGRTVKPGLEKIFLSWGASGFGADSFAQLENNVSLGNAITLRRDSYANWFVWHNGHKVGRLRADGFKIPPISATLTGLAIASITAYTLAESEQYDTKHGTTFTSTFWLADSAARRRGYIYIVDIAGFYPEQ